MARRTFDVADIMEILVHWYAGRSRSEGVHHRAAEGRGHGDHCASAAAGLAGGGGGHFQFPPVCGRERAGGDAPVQGEGAAPVPGRAGR
jgi:hypothetical protein